MTDLKFNLLPGEHPIVPVMFGDAVVASKVAEEMLKRGVYVVAFSYPVVPMGKARIRTQVSAAHSKRRSEIRGGDVCGVAGGNWVLRSFERYGGTTNDRMIEGAKAEDGAPTVPYPKEEAYRGLIWSFWIWTLVIGISLGFGSLGH